VLPPNPLREIVQDEASDEYGVPNPSPTLGTQVQDRKPVREGRRGAEEKERSCEVAVYSTAAMGIQDTGHSHP
ncbi:MAG TPA: hypothetical protein VJP78_15145, partial [Thermoleophilia bacterium]|nr:hypothetical protein [Thermoleophilia bacterium]